MIKNKQKLKINKKMKKMYKMYKTNKMDFAKKLIKIYSLIILRNFKELEIQSNKIKIQQEIKLVKTNVIVKYKRQEDINQNCVNVMNNLEIIR